MLVFKNLSKTSGNPNRMLQNITKSYVFFKNPLVLENPENYFPITNTYEKKLTKNIKYISDSGGTFRYGHPLESETFLNFENIQ